MTQSDNGLQDERASRGRAQANSSGKRQLDLAYQAIRQDIMSCALEPGTDFTEADFAARYGYGRATIRAALMRLAQDRLVVAQPRRGYQITSVTLQDVRDLFQLRSMLEPEAMSLAVEHIDIDTLNKLNALCANARSHEVYDRMAVVEANHDFHLYIIRASGNQRLVEVLERILDEMRRLFVIGLTSTIRRAEMRHEHDDLVRAFVDHNVKAVRAAAAKHIESMRLSVIDRILVDSKVREKNIF